MEMHRIETTDKSAHWRYCCPECDSTNWRANNGAFGCRSCGNRLSGLKDKKTGKFIPREQIEFVGPESSWKAPYAVRRRSD